ncbi:rhodanese-like domain-containing protein [Streptomyces sp. WMMC897]|uniref:rhodanese-like domain-containing protein n=1 Tax=Streptomyces sp. WMMC897 TaxID=3014782 RepID=UPI0022B6E925|nr:rhodanese-like domain-containing protein [Streptomyces sp. WMMC897]MCZ7413939.1 rhodanese-like domain-containing protein [Streptomyces sp. WMMC897]
MTTPTTPRGLTADALRAKLDSPHPPRLLDVRSPAEFEGAHIPGAYNVPLDTLREHREELTRHLDTDVVLVCRSGQRADQAERALAEAGLPGLAVLSGGMTAWEKSGAPTNYGQERWDMERQVRLVAGALVLLGAVGSFFLPGLQALSAFVGGGLAFAAISNTCAMGVLLSRMPWNRTPSFDPRKAVAQLAHGR